MFNRQLHPDEYKLAKDNAKLVAKKLGITYDEAEGRIVRQLQRNVDGATAQQDGLKRDEPIISILGCALLNCDAKNTDVNYWRSTYNAEYIKPNQSSYDKGSAQSSAGMTPQQIEDRNNRAGAPIAKAGAVILGGYVLAPTVAVIGTEVIAFARNPVAYCAANPTACIGAVDVAAGTSAGVPLTGVPVPHSVPNVEAVGARRGVELANLEAQNIANASRLAEQLKMQSAKSPFTSARTLTQDAIDSAKPIPNLEAGKLNNPALPSGFGKYSTDTFQSPAGDFTMHFYKNPTTGEVFYGLAYKAVLNKMSGVPKKP